MSEKINMTICPGCRVQLSRGNYPGDNRYGVLSAECRQAFDEILLREGELFGYPKVHRLMVDSYAVQYPPVFAIQQKLGIEQRFIDASIQSVAIHLIALHLAIEQKCDLSAISSIMNSILTTMNRKNISFQKLVAPLSLGTMRAVEIRDVLKKYRMKN